MGQNGGDGSDIEEFLKDLLYIGEGGGGVHVVLVCHLVGDLGIREVSGKGVPDKSGRFIEGIKAVESSGLSMERHQEVFVPYLPFDDGLSAGIKCTHVSGIIVG